MHISKRSGASLALFLAIWLPPALAEDDKAAPHAHDALEEIVVHATPLDRETAELTQSATVLQGESLRRQLGNSVGETLSRLPGLADASFGQNVGRPVIRGLQGARVGVLTNNMAVNDASAVSQDHAVAVEPFLADQIEVLRGPSTLLYGSGAIGGVVNMVSHTIPDSLPENGFNGRALLQGNTAANEGFGAARLDVGASSFAFHVDGFYRRTDDYDIPGPADLYPEEGEGEAADSGVLQNSFLDNEGGSFGASWIGEDWRFGASYTLYDANYGIPGAEEEEDTGELVFVTIDLESKRLNADLVGENPFAGFQQLAVRFVDTDYQHTEFEGEETGTVFNSDSINVRAELEHNPWGSFEGAFGLQYIDLDFSAIGEEAFVPSSTTQTAAIFWVESADFETWILDLGLRYDDVDVEAPEPLTDPEVAGDIPTRRSFGPFSASIGGLWHLTEATDVTLSVSRAQRAPNVEELYAFGPHIASQIFEVGDPSLDTETDFHLEGGLRFESGGFTGSLTAYADWFKDYIYQAETGLEEDGFPVYLWAQQDADFVGGELELAYDLGDYTSGNWQVSAFYDIVKADLQDGNDVPLMPPSRYGFGIDWNLNNWTAYVSWIHAAAQTDLAPRETPTPGYNLLDAEIAFSIPMKDRFEWELFLKGHNILDDDIRNSTSLLKNTAPQIGRNFIFGVRAFF